MLNSILRFIYKRYETKFQDFMVESLVGYIPKDVHEPTVEFLKQGSEKLEKWLLFQSYQINRRAITDFKNTERYQGMLVNIKTFLLISAAKQQKEIPKEKEREKEEDPLVGVEKFLNNK